MGTDTVRRGSDQSLELHCETVTASFHEEGIWGHGTRLSHKASPGSPATLSKAGGPLLQVTSKPSARRQGSYSEGRGHGDSPELPVLSKQQEAEPG